MKTLDEFIYVAVIIDFSYLGNRLDTDFVLYLDKTKDTTVCSR